MPARSRNQITRPWDAVAEGLSEANGINEYAIALGQPSNAPSAVDPNGIRQSNIRVFAEGGP
jgi:hypothetical protein